MLSFGAQGTLLPHLAAPLAEHPTGISSQVVAVKVLKLKCYDLLSGKPSFGSCSQSERLPEGKVGEGWGWQPGLRSAGRAKRA